jgi:glutathione synthase
MNVYNSDKPLLSEKQLESLVENVHDYQLTHGSLLKIVNAELADLAFSRPVPASLFPSRFPKKAFEDAVHIQGTFNELYARLATDEGYLSSVLQAQINDDPFTKTLWEIHLEAKSKGPAQPTTLGIFRSDYMVSLGETRAPSASEPQYQIKQVEFNTFSVAGGTHTNLVADMHLHCHRIGAFGDHYGDPTMTPSSIPANETIAGLIQGLVTAHLEYGLARNAFTKRTGVLYIVQHDNFNVCDERPLEYGLWNHSSSIPTYRLEFRKVLEYTSLGPSRELLFNSPSCPFSPLEISVVYLRAGLDPVEYDEQGRAARLLLEQSIAIKCPTVLSHLTTFKKIQQELVVPGVLERFLSPIQCAQVRSTFAPMYPLDSSELGLRARAIATNLEKAKNYILKPSLEGGGNNVYGTDIPNFLETIPEERWHTFILMERINSPTQDGVLMSSEGIYQGPTISELGVFGVCLWRKSAHDDNLKLSMNRQVGWSFKTKPEEVEEMSVVKGYGFFDSPCLVDR